jgi:SAM-dependent methyltransferase
MTPTGARGGPEDRREFFDRMAQVWKEKAFTPDEERKIARLQERLGDLRGRAVFEPGCGTGRLTRLLARWAGPTGRVVAVDENPKMAEAARSVMEESPSSVDPCPSARVEIRLGDAGSIALAPGSVDLALLFCVFPHLRDQAAALRAIRRMLAPDGRLVIAHLTGSAALNAMHRQAGAAVRHDRLPPRSELTRMLCEAGLRVTEFVDEPEDFYLEAAAVQA